jgi:hypothetical protein
MASHRFPRNDSRRGARPYAGLPMASIVLVPDGVNRLQTLEERQTAKRPGREQSNLNRRNAAAAKPTIPMRKSSGRQATSLRIVGPVWIMG